MRSRFIICITLLGCFFISQFAFASENPLTASVPSFAPFQFINDDEKCQGVAVVALQKITADITEPINLVFLPYARIIYSLEYGQLDLALVFKNNYLNDSVDYIGPVSKSRVVVLTHLNMPIHQYSELKKLSSIAVIRGAKFEDKFDNDNELSKFSVESYHQAIKMFKLGRVDAVVGSLVGLDFELREQNLDINILEKSFQLGEKEWWLHLSKKSSYQYLLPQLALAVEKNYRPDFIYQTYLKHLNNCQSKQ
jgi:polar amino acid transport system substrate-binding protein